MIHKRQVFKSNLSLTSNKLILLQEYSAQRDFKLFEPVFAELICGYYPS